MRPKEWQRLINNSPDPQRASHYLSQLRTAAPRVLPELEERQAAVLVALLGGSVALSEYLLLHPDLLSVVTAVDALEQPRSAQGMQREVHGWLLPLLKARDYASALRQLRAFKQKEMLRIAVRDLGAIGNVLEIIQEISDVADLTLESVYEVCRRQLSERFGSPFHHDADRRWRPTPFCIFGMGKLGGQELNYSSDVDVLFVYGEEGHLYRIPPRGKEQSGKGMTNHQFFNRLAEAFILEVGRMTPDGTLYRIDLRLRPEGKTGPLTRSLTSYENYYSQWGQTWERMMLIKARCVAGDPQLASEFTEMAQPFRYPRSLNERILKEVFAMKERTEREIVGAAEIDRNVKLGRGGIREIEFVVQTLQLLNAGKIPFLQTHQTMTGLDKISQYHTLPREQSALLEAAYQFLRRVEHRLQMENNLQTHTIPTERRSRERLARQMGFETLRAFEIARQKHSANVRQIYDRLLRKDESSEPGLLPAEFDEMKEQWRDLLLGHSFRDPEKAFSLIRNFALGPGYGHMSGRTTDLARELVTRFLAWCPRSGGAGQLSARSAGDPLSQSSKIKITDDKTLESTVLSDPDRVLARVDSFVAAYGARASLYEMWSSNPAVFELVLILFDRSEFLAEVAIRTPDLVDELALSGRLQRNKSAQDTLRDLRHGLEDDDQRVWIRRYHQAELMRIGLRDILGLSDFSQSLIELSGLAEACLQYALEVALRRQKIRGNPIAIMGLGKLGGAELNYGSDLDILFVAAGSGVPIAALQKVAIQIMDLLGSQTEWGTAFEIDTRLRPDGEKGLLVNTITAHDEYYRQRAMLWEIQALTRIRFIAGSIALGRDMERRAASLTDFSKQPALAGYSPEWKQEIARMRSRIELERTPRGKQDLAIKTGAGGLIDAEFIAQYFALERGWHQPNTLDVLTQAVEGKVLLESDRKSLIEPYLRLRRVEGILRRWSFAGETMLPDDPAALLRVAVRCGYANANEFVEAVQRDRKAIRNVYSRVFAEVLAPASR